MRKIEALERLGAVLHAALCNEPTDTGTGRSLIRPWFLKSSGRAESGKPGDAFCWEHNAVIICRDGHRSLRPSRLQCGEPACPVSGWAHKLDEITTLTQLGSRAGSAAVAQRVSRMPAEGSSARRPLAGGIASRAPLH